MSQKLVFDQNNFFNFRYTCHLLFTIQYIQTQLINYYQIKVKQLQLIISIKIQMIHQSQDQFIVLGQELLQLPLFKKKSSKMKQQISKQTFQIRYKFNRSIEKFTEQIYQKQYRICSNYFQNKTLALSFIKNKNFLYFSYRDNFTDTLQNTTESFTSDVSWGCTFRVGSMLLARALIMHQKKRGVGGEISQQKMRKIAQEFLDQDGNQKSRKYSIRQFFNDVELRKKIGYHLNFPQYFYRMQKLNREKPQPAFEIENCNHGVITISSILEKMGYNNICQCQLQKISCQNCNKPNIKMPKSMLMVVHTGIQFGFEDQIDLKEKLFRILNLQEFAGCMGGYRTFSYYIFGTENQDSLIYLDPHQVQSSQNIINSKVYETYTPKQFFSINYKKIKKQLALGFYVKNKRELQTLIKKLKQIDINSIVIQFRKKSVENQCEQLEQSLMQSQQFALLDYSKIISKLQQTTYQEI